MLNLTKLATVTTTHQDVLRLPYDLRQKCRQRVRLLSGAEAGLLLPRGLALHAGDLLCNDDGTVTVLVEADTELVSIAHCEDPLLLARICYHLGNRHVALQIEPNEVRYLHDHVLDEMVEKLGIAVRSDRLPFEPEPGAYAGTHKHAHHHHDHDH